MTRFEDELEREVDRELSALGARRAPSTLLPRVLAAAGRPWYHRAWLTWPVAAQAASVVAMLAFALGLVSFFGAVGETFGTASALVRIGWRVVFEPAVLYAFALAVVMALAVSASWAALTHVALGGASE